MDNVLVVHKKSVYENYKKGGDAELQKFLDSGSADAFHMKESHRIQLNSLNDVISQTRAEKIPSKCIYRADLAELGMEKINNFSLIVCVGGDGTLLEVSHYVKDVPILGVNSDPEGSSGFFSACDASGFCEILRNIENYPRTAVSRLEMTLDGKVLPELVLNDMLIAHPNPCATTRYTITINNYSEKYKNSGLLVCAPAGSTAWMYNEGGEVMPFESKVMQYLLRGTRKKTQNLQKN